jgi:L-asparaginase
MVNASAPAGRYVVNYTAMQRVEGHRASAAGTPRSVRLLAAGGTISMRGDHAVPALDGAQLIAELPELDSGPPLQAETVLAVPGAHLTLSDSLRLANRARDAARAGEGVVITTGTDTMEELAVLCALVHDGEAPIVLTGANRPGSQPGADGPANLLDAVAVAAAPQAAGLGAVIVFGGEIHGAMTTRKVDSTGPTAFGSPTAGPLGRVVERRVWLHAMPIRPAALDLGRLANRVVVVTTGLGDDGAMLRHASRSADGVVLVALGAGHLPLGVMEELEAAADRVPVVITCRPERSSMMFSTYGFAGAERDLRASTAICAPFLSPAAARVTLLCCLGAGLDRAGTRAALAPWDAA